MHKTTDNVIIDSLFLQFSLDYGPKIDAWPGNSRISVLAIYEFSSERNPMNHCDDSPAVLAIYEFSSERNPTSRTAVLDIYKLSSERNSPLVRKRVSAALDIYELSSERNVASLFGSTI